MSLDEDVHEINTIDSRLDLWVQKHNGKKKSNRKIYVKRFKFWSRTLLLKNRMKRAPSLEVVAVVQVPIVNYLNVKEVVVIPPVVEKTEYSEVIPEHQLKTKSLESVQTETRDDEVDEGSKALSKLAMNYMSAIQTGMPLII